MKYTFFPTLVPAALIAVTIAIVGIVSTPHRHALSDAVEADGAPGNGVWNYDIAVRVWRTSPYPRIHQAQGEWMLVAGAYDRPLTEVSPIRDPRGVTRPNGSEYPLLGFRYHDGNLQARFIDVEATTTAIATHTSLNGLLPDPMQLNERGLSMTCRHIAQTLRRPEQLLCRREVGPADGPTLVNMECYSRAGIEHPGSCLF